MFPLPERKQRSTKSSRDTHLKVHPSSGSELIKLRKLQGRQTANGKTQKFTLCLLEDIREGILSNLPLPYFSETLCAAGTIGHELVILRFGYHNTSRDLK